MLGAQPQDEDFPPDDPDDVDPNNFDFFGFGQPSHGPAPPNYPNQPFGPLNANLGNQAWAPWNDIAGPDAAHPVAPEQVAPIQPIEEEASVLIPLQPEARFEPIEEII